MLAQGYIDLGLCKGTLDEVLETGSYKQFYMHRAGHWLGLDVHDAGPLPGEGRVAEARARHGAHRRAGHVHPARRQRARALLEHRRAHRGRRAGHGDRHREPDRGRAEDGGRRRGRLRADERAPRADAARSSSSSARARSARRSRWRSPTPTSTSSSLDARAAGRRRCAATARSRCRTARGSSSSGSASGRALAAMPGAVTPIAAIDISQAGGFGVDAADGGRAGPAGAGLRRLAIARCRRRSTPRSRARGIDVRYGVDGRRASAARPRTRRSTLRRRRPTALLARLAVVADGAGAAVAGVARERRDYGQVALIAKVWTRRAARGRRVRALHARRPDRAAAGRRSLRSRLDDDAGRGARALLALPDDAFLARARAAFRRRGAAASRASRDRRTFPLALEFARPTVGARVRR